MRIRNKCLIAVQGSSQFIAAYLALKWYEHKIGKMFDATLLVYDTFVPKVNETLVFEGIRKIAEVQDWENMIFISSEEMRKNTFLNYGSCIKKMMVSLGSNNFDTIFLAGDFGNFGTSLILDCYPTAYKVEFGDSFGLVGNEMDEKKSWFFRIKLNPLNFVKLMTKKIMFLQFYGTYTFDISILSMPIDFTGKGLVGKKLEVPNKNFISEVFKNLSDNLPLLNNYCKVILGDKQNENKLYLLSNLYNSNFTTLEDEINLYEDVITRTATKDSVIILKNHPRGLNEIIEKLSQKLIKLGFNVKTIDDVSFNFYPIELWGYLLENCKVYPVFSSSVISIKYFFSKNVTMPLTEEIIHKFVYKHRLQETFDSETMCRLAMEKLDSWNESEPLWIGNN